MEILDTRFLGNPLETWGLALLMAAGAYLVLEGCRRLLGRNLGKFARWTTGEFDDLLVDLIQRTSFFFLAGLAVYIAAGLVVLPDRARGTVGWAVMMAVVWQCGLWGSQVIEYFIGAHLRTLGEDPSAETTLKAMGFIGRLLLWTVLLLLGLSNMGVNIGALLAGMGVGGIAVALAVQKILGDLFASLSIVLDKPFVLGDFIIVDDYMGSVEHIGLKTTRLRSLSGEQLVFGNNDLLSSRIRNYKRMNERRILFAFGVTYQTPREKLERIPTIVREILAGIENTRLDRAHFKGFGGSSLDFEVVYYMLVPDYNAYMDVQQKVNLELYSRFGEEDIEFAYPTRTLFLEGGWAAPETAPEVEAGAA